MKEFSRHDLLEGIPQIQDIQDETLRERTIKAWELAFMDGNFDNLPAARFNKFCDYVTLLQHTRSVTRMSILLGESLRDEYHYEINMDKLISIAALHDISKLLENEPLPDGGVRQTEIGQSYQHGFFSSYYSLQAGIPADIGAAILTHTHQTKTLPVCLEGIIVTYADLADADSHRLQLGKPLHVKDLH